MSPSIVVKGPAEPPLVPQPPAPGPSVSAAPVTTPAEPGAPAGARRDAVRKVLLGCGVLSSVLYVGTAMYA